MLLLFREATYTVTPTSVTVPYLIGDTLVAAAARIDAIYCTASVTGSAGTVISQSPVAFTVVPRGTAISITMGGPVNGRRGRRWRGMAPYNSRQS